MTCLCMLYISIPPRYIVAYLNFYCVHLNIIYFLVSIPMYMKYISIDRPLCVSYASVPVCLCVCLRVLYMRVAPSPVNSHINPRTLGVGKAVCGECGECRS